MLYMAWLPLADGRYREVKLSGQVYYGADNGYRHSGYRNRQTVQGNYRRTHHQAYIQNTGQEGPQPRRVPLLPHQQPILPRKERTIEESEMQPFYRYGRLIAVLEQGARAQGQIPWLELYYPRGFLPWVGLRDPLRKHMQSVLPFLERRGRADRYLAQLNSLANALQNSEEPPQDSASFDSWCTRYLSHDRSPKPELPLKSTPQGRAAVRPGLPG